MTWYKKLNCQSDFHEIRCRRSLQRLSINCEFRQNLPSDSHTSITSSNEFLPKHSTFLDRSGGITYRFSRGAVEQLSFVKTEAVKAMHYWGVNRKLPVCYTFSPVVGNIRHTRCPQTFVGWIWISWKLAQVCRFGWNCSTSIQNCTLDGHLHRVTYRINTIDSPDDEHRGARNM